MFSSVAMRLEFYAAIPRSIFCNNCKSVPVGSRYHCLTCDGRLSSTEPRILSPRLYVDFDLCETCEQLPSLDVKSDKGMHHSRAHPTIKCTRPVIDFEGWMEGSFRSMFSFLSDERELDASETTSDYNSGECSKIIVHA